MKQVFNHHFPFEYVTTHFDLECSFMCYRMFYFIQTTVFQWIITRNNEENNVLYFSTTNNVIKSVIINLDLLSIVNMLILYSSTKKFYSFLIS